MLNKGLLFFDLFFKNKNNFNESKVILENNLYEINSRGKKIEIIYGVGAVLTTGEGVKKFLAGVLQKKGFNVGIDDMKNCARIGYNENKGVWEVHSSMDVTNEHSSHWKLNGVEEDGRGYYVLTKDSLYILLKTGDEKIRNYNMCTILLELKKPVLGKTCLRILKGVVGEALERSKNDNKLFIDILNRKGITFKFMKEYGEEIKKIIKGE